MTPPGRQARWRRERGPRRLLRQALDQQGLPDRFAARAPLPTPCPLAAALRALEGCSEQASYDDIVDWIGGLIRPTPALRRALKKPPTLYTSGEVARQYAYLLSAWSVLATMVGYRGLAVLIDESEHYSLLRATQRGRADAFFKALIYAALGPLNTRIDPSGIPDHPRLEYPLGFASEANLFFLFALTESENRMPVDTWLAPAQIIRLDDRFIERDLRAFYGMLLRYHALAYDYEPAHERHDEVVAAVPGLLARTLGQHRINLRELIRLAVTVCDLLYLYPTYSPGALLEELRRGLGVGEP